MANKNENDLIKGIAPKKVGHEAVPSPKEFKPWHKPRKQWVRKEQWCKETKALIPRLRLDGRPLRYLSLPGEDMLDIRVMAHLCKENGLSLKCLGYDESAQNQTEVNISLNEVSNNIVPTSTILPDNISVLKNERSQAFKYVRDLGPFDIINLDLCGAISCISYPDNHQVLYNLCNYQINNCREPWLLFLTTRAEFKEVNLQHMPHYLQSLKSNAEKYESFGERLNDITKFDIHSYSEQADLTNLFAMHAGQDFVKLFAAGFGKWLLCMMLGNGSIWKVEMLDSFWYRVEDNQEANSFPNMLSLAYCFTPINVPLVDPSGLAVNSPEMICDEVNLAMRILEKTDLFIDLDLILDNDESLFNQLVTESADLLRTARYPSDQYAKWADKKRIHFNSN